MGNSEPSGKPKTDEQKKTMTVPLRGWEGSYDVPPMKCLSVNL